MVVGTSLSRISLLGIMLCVLTVPTMSGSFELGRKKSGGPSFDDSGFRLLDGFNAGVGMHGVDGWVVAVGDFNRCERHTDSGSLAV